MAKQWLQHSFAVFSACKFSKKIKSICPIFFSSEFGKERERVENRTAFLRLRQGQQADRALDGYMDWLDKAEQAMVREEEEETETSMFIGCFLSHPVWLSLCCLLKIMETKLCLLIENPLTLYSRNLKV